MRKFASSAVQLRQESMSELLHHAEIPSSFEFSTILDVTEAADGLVLQERQLERPRIKNYDAIENPLGWLDRFDTSSWTLIGAFEGTDRIGGVIGAVDCPQLDMLEGRNDLIVLWDLRVAPHARGRGLGGRLFSALEASARAKDCKELKVETQNINVAACRLYGGQGCQLAQANRFAYPDLPDEVQLIWRKSLRHQGPAAGSVCVGP